MSIFKADIIKKVQVLVQDKEKYDEFRAELDDIRVRHSYDGRASPMKIVASSLEEEEENSPIRCNFEMAG